MHLKGVLWWCVGGNPYKCSGTSQDRHQHMDISRQWPRWGEKTRRSQSGFFVFINRALIQWLSKKQATIETSVFGAKFVAMKLGMESLRGLQYKLRMMGMPIDGPLLIYRDNMLVIHNTQQPDLTLKKKISLIAYHAVWESVALGELLTVHVNQMTIPVNLATKVLYGKKRWDMVLKLLYNIYNDDE